MNKKIVGFTCGSFDLLHPGHIQMFKEAKEQCDYLIVGLQTDPTLDRSNKNKPIQTIEERIIMLSAIKYISKIIVYTTEESLYKLLTKIKPDVRVIGNDWKCKEYTGHDLPIKMFFNSRNHNWSTSELRKRILNYENL